MLGSYVEVLKSDLPGAGFMADWPVFFADMNVKITIKAETVVPNTSDIVFQDIVFNRTLETKDHEQLLVEAYREVELALELTLKAELQKRGVEDGLDFHI